QDFSEGYIMSPDSTKPDLTLIFRANYVYKNRLPYTAKKVTVAPIVAINEDPEILRIRDVNVNMISWLNVQKQTSSPVASSTASPVNIDNNMFIDSSLDTSEDSKIQTMLKQENQRLMDIISGTIPNSKSPAPLLPDDCQLVAKAVEETLSNTDVVTSDTSIAGFAGSNELMQNVYTTTQKHPFQMDQLNSVNRSTSAIVSSLDKNLNYIFVDNRENLQEPLSRVTVEEELRTKYDTYYKDRYETDVGNEEGFQQLVDTVYQQRQFKRKTQESRINVVSYAKCSFKLIDQKLTDNYFK
ncbi:Hypothetical predicted protein, partial [Mytilus galloprovincialis]